MTLKVIGAGFGRTGTASLKTALETLLQKPCYDPDRLLVFETKDGWGPLCQFLDIPEPKEPYPHINSKAEFEAVFGLLRSPLGAQVMNGDGIPSETIHKDLFEAK